MKYLKLIGKLILVVFLLLFVALWSAVHSNELKPLTVDAFLEKMVNGLQSHLPIEVDEYTRTDAIALEPGRRVIVDYTINLPSHTDWTDSIGGILQESATDFACTQKGARFLLNNGVTLVYRYHNTDEVSLYNTEITIIDCLAPTKEESNPFQWQGGRG